MSADLSYASRKQQILSFAIVRVAKRPFNALMRKFGMDHDLSDLLTIVLTEILASIAIFGLWNLFRIPVNPRGYLWVLWGNLLTVFCVELVMYNMSRFLDIMDLHSKQVFRHKEGVFLSWVEKTFDMRKQIIVSSVFAILIFPFTLLFFDQTINFLANRVGCVVLFINMWIIGNGFYWVWALPTSAKAIYEASTLEGYFDPKNTVWIADFSDIYERAAMSVSLIGAMVLVSFSAPSLPIIRLISIGWLLILLLLIVVPFLYAQYYLLKMINFIRISLMTNLQSQIYEIVSSSDSARLNKIEIFLSIYDKTKLSESSLIRLSSGLQFINSVLLPILSFAIANYKEMIDLIQRLFNLF